MQWFPVSASLHYLHPPNVDIDECLKENDCGQNAKCINTLGSYYCVCNNGFGLKSGKLNFTGRQEQCEG